MMAARKSQPIISRADIRRYESIINSMAPLTETKPDDVERGEGSWYAVYTNPNCEGRAVWSLTAKGFYTFYPTMKKWVRSGRKKRVSESSLMARYVFVFVKPGQHRGFMLGCDGVQGIVETAGSNIIPDDAIDFLMAHQDAGTYDLTKPRLQVDQAVRITSGPFAGLAGKILKAPSEERVWILLEAAGIIDRAKVKLADVIAA